MVRGYNYYVYYTVWNVAWVSIAMHKPKSLQRNCISLSRCQFNKDLLTLLFFQIFLQHLHWLNKLLSLRSKAQSLSMDKSPFKSPFKSGNSVSVVVCHGRCELFVRIDMNKYAQTQITQDNLPWGHWKLIALYIITLGFSVHQMENISRENIGEWQWICQTCQCFTLLHNCTIW